MDSFDLSRRVAVITGGLGQLGRQFTKTLAGRGARVVILDPAPVSEVARNEIGDLMDSGTVRHLQTDIAARPELEAALATVTQDGEAPSILINNAALDSPPNSPAEENGPFEDYPIESLEKIIRVNLTGLFLTCQVFGGAMARAGRGSVINIGSTYGMVSPNQDIYEYRRKDGAQFFKPAPYAMTKSAVYNFTRYLATYWARKGVRVNAISPAGIFNNQDEEFLSAYTARMPMGRMAEPDEINGAVVFLASDASSYVTGANLVVDGGWTAW